MNEKHDYIAVFDSGVGGISVLKHLVKHMPGERYLYFGDSANAPYGSRSTEEVRLLSLQAVEQLRSQGIKALVVACNTATAAAIETLRQTYPDLIVVGIEPALKPAADRFPGGTVGVLATEVTLREKKFHRLMEHYSGTCEVLRLPAPGLVELVEAGKGNSAEAEALLRPILEPIKDRLNALVLGCTHYPFACAAIRRILGDQVLLIDGGEGTARETKRRLEQAGLLEEGDGGILWQNSRQSEGYETLGKALLETEWRVWTEIF